MDVQVLGKGRAVSAGSGWHRAAGTSVWYPRALGRRLPSSPGEKSKLTMSLAGGRELQILEEELWWSEAGGAGLVNTNSLTTRLSMDTLGSAWTGLCSCASPLRG